MAHWEAERIAALFDTSTILVGKSATESRLNSLQSRAGLREFGTIHFATHALVHPFDPERSAIALAQSGRAASRAGLQPPYYDDGLITTREILYGWDLDADLVCLSGCQTAKGPKSTRDGPLGFHQALLGAGARAIVTSAWEVDDVATALLMSRFYENLTGSYETSRNGAIGRRLPKADALREAKLWIKTLEDDRGRMPFEHPAYWAGFVLVGDPN
jgi:CHAT domain-containing protein